MRALDRVSFQIEAGEKAAISGPSGSGKSTLMNIIGCLMKPDSGQYWLAGEDVSQLPSNRLAAIRNRYIGFVFQSFNLLHRLSALENVELPCFTRAIGRRRERAQEALDVVGLGDGFITSPISSRAASASAWRSPARL